MTILMTSEPATLTPRERQVATLLAYGHTNAEIARRIYLSRSTVAGHLTAIFRRLGVRSRSELAGRFSASG